MFRNLLRAAKAAGRRRPRGERRTRWVRLAVEALEPRILLAGAASRLPIPLPEPVPFHVAGSRGRAADAAGILQVPGQPGQAVAVRFTCTLRDAVFHNELGLFLVDDAQGRIDGLKPGDPGYAAAALSRARGHVLFAPGRGPGASRTLELPAGRFFGLYLVQNATTAQFLARNPRNRPGRGPVAFFSFAEANPDRVRHLRGLAGGRFGFEDALGGGDRDFNDLVARVEFGAPPATPAPPPGTPTPPVVPPGTGVTTVTPPVVTARLRNDTAPGGTTNADGVTADPAVAGTVAASAGVASLLAGFDAAPATAFVDVTAALGPGGQFALDRARLAQVAGGSLPDGAHTLHLRAADAAGNPGLFDLPFTLDTGAAAVTFQDPRPGLVTNAAPTVTGRAADALSGVAALQAQLDGGTPFAVTVGADGSFHFPTTLPPGGAADGAHTIRLVATDLAGNVSDPFDAAFTLDATPPAVVITSPAADLTTNTRVTVTGRATDALAGINSVQAQVDGGPFADVFLDPDGTFRLPVDLPLDGSADGAHTARFRATDKAGNVSAVVPVTFTLDATAPVVVITAPDPDLTGRLNVTVIGRVSDNLSGVASLQAQLDGGAALPVSFDASGNYTFATTLALDGSTDGSHTVSLRAADNAGNSSPLAQVSFALDTTPPAVAVTGPAPGSVSSANVTVTGRVTDALSGVDSLEAQVDAGAFAAVTLDAAGNFSFPTALPLDGSADGSHTVTLRAADRAGNVGAVPVSFTLDTGLLLREGTAFRTSREQTLTIPADPSALTFTFGNLSFDTTAQHAIQDAFEAALVDADGQPLVHTIGAGRDAFFNVSDGQAPALGAGTALAGQTVTVNLAGVPAGTTARLIYRLVNNDGDTNTSVRITQAQIVPNPGAQPAAATPEAAAARSGGRVDLAALADVSAAFTPGYGRTAFDEAAGVLHADLVLTNTGQYPVDAPLVVEIAHLSDAAVRVLGADGTAPDGTPYYDLSGLVGGRALAPGAATAPRRLEFFNPNRTPFTYDLVVLGRLNRPPAFTSQPNAEALVGVPYVYQAAATDPDGDALTFSLVAAPAGMAVAADTGRITWAPAPADRGTQTVIVQADDGRGGSMQQRYELSVIDPPPNRPPVVTSTPVVDAQVNTAYRYPAQATDPDGDALTFALVGGPDGLTVDPPTGLVSWTPAAAQLGTQAVTLRVTDGHGGSADQVYQVRVGSEAGNHDPVFVSEPPTQFNLPAAGNPPVGAVNPAGVDLNLGQGDTATTPVSITIPTTGAVPMVDVFLLLDDTGSFSSINPLITSQFPSIVTQLQTSLPDQNLAFGVGRFEDYANLAQVGTSAGGEAPDGRPFILSQPILTTTTPGFDVALRAALDRTTPGSGGDVAEAMLEALYQTATGVGFDGNGDGDTIDSGPATLVGTQINPGDSGDVPAFASANDLVLYRFRVLDPATQPVLVPNTAITGSLDPRLESRLFTFTGTAGQRVFFDSLLPPLTFAEPVSGAQWTLYDLGGHPVASQPVATDFEVTLPLTGPYTLVLQSTLATPSLIGVGDIPADYAFQMLLPATTTKPLALDTPVSGTIASPGDRGQYTFTLTNSSLLYFDALTNDPNLTWSLAGPAGTAVNSRTFTASDASGFTENPVLNLFAAGDYTLTVERTGDSTGPYQFALRDLTRAAPLTPGAPVSGSLAPANETDLYRFTAAAGDRFSFDVLARGGGAANATWRLIDPYGSSLFLSGLGSVAPLTLAAAGAYTLLVEGNVAEVDAGTYTINVQPQGNVPPAVLSSTPYALGSLQSGTIAAAGEQDRYSFTLSDRSLLYFDSLTNNSNLTWTLTGPAGTAVGNRNFTGSDGNSLPVFVSTNPVLNLVSGDYTLTVSASGGATGDYAFRLSDLTQATPLTPGTPVSSSLSPADETDLYRFDAGAGDRFFFDVQARSGTSNAIWRLIDPYGNVLFNTSFANTPSSDVDVLTLSQPGMYTLLLEGAIGDTTANTYTVNVQPVTFSTRPLTLGTTVSDAIAVAGEQDRYTFTLATTSLLYFDALAGDGGVNWTLTGPAGTAVSKRSFTLSDGSSGPTNPALNLVAGDYTLTIDAPGDLTSPYSFRLSDLTQATPLTPGTPVTDSLGSQTDLYRFDANAGDHFFFDVQALTGSPHAVWRLIGPHGNVLFNSPLSDVDTLTLADAGTYVLLVEGSIADTGTGSYTVNVRPVTFSTQPLTLGTTVSDAIAVAGEQDRYTFTLASASQLYFDALTNNGSLTWTLTGPAGAAVSNRPFTQSDGNNITNPTFSLVAGDYTLTIDATGDQTGAYAFRLSDPTQATPLTPGTPVSGALSPANETDLYRFDASAGDRFFFDAQARSGAPGASWRLLDSFGNVVFSSSFADVDVQALPRTGAYTLLVEGAITDTAAGAYTINVQPAPVATAALTLGTTVSGNLATPGKQDRYTFTLGSASLLYFDALTNSSALTWTLSGTTASNRPFNSSDGINVPDPALRLLPGDYALTVDLPGDQTGAYAFRLSDLTQAAPLTPGTPVGGSLDPANETDLYRFDASAGDRFFFDVQARSGAPDASWRLLDPFGNVVFNAPLGDVDAQALPRTGTYTLLVEGALSVTTAGTYTINVQPAPVAPAALALGSTVSGNLATPGKQDRYTFTLTTASLLYFDALTNSSNLTWTLTGPAGVAVNNRSFGVSDGSSIANPAVNLMAGAYALTVDLPGDQTGAYAFRLSDLTQAAPLTPGTPVNGTLNPGNETDLYQFPASAGDRFSFDALTSTNVTWRLLDPYGNGVFNTAFADVATLTLAQPGTYTLLVEGPISNTAAANYSFNVQPQGNVPPPAPPPSTAYTLGATVSNSIAVAGEQDRYSFTLGRTSLLYFDALTNDGNLTWTLAGPAGIAVSNRRFTLSDGFGTFANPVLNLPAGDYTLTVSGSSSGNYSFRLWDLAQATPLTPGTPVSGSLSPANETDLYQFTASSGDRFFFDAQARSGAPNASWRLLDPFGNVVFNSTRFSDTSSDVDVQTLTTAGTYTLLLEGAINDTGSGAYTMNVRPAVIDSAPLVLGATASGAIATPGEQDRYTFTLTSAALLYFDALADNQNLTWTLAGPAGITVSNRRFTSSDDGGIANPVLNLVAGDYALTVDLPGDQTGAYAFRLSDLTQAAPLTPGTVISGSLSPANATDLYRFTAGAGDRFIFDALTNLSATWRLLDPFGIPVFSTSFFDVPTQTLASAGAYTLLVEGQVSATGAGDYSFIVRPQSNLPPATPYALGSLLSDSIAVAEQQDRYSFTLADRSPLYFDALTNNASLTWTLEGPAGTAVSNRSFTFNEGNDFSHNPVLDLPAGDYVLTVSGVGGFTGAYQLRLSDLRQATPLTPGQLILGDLTPANATELYRFDATAGQTFDFDVAARFGATNARWRLIDPYGAVLFTNKFTTGDVGPLTVTAAGTYTLLLEGAIEDTTAGEYALTVYTAQGEQGTLSVDTPVGGDLIQPADSDRYTFEGVAGQQFYFDGLDARAHEEFAFGRPLAGSPSGIRVQITSPGGVSIVPDLNNADADGGPILLPETGTYTVTVSAPATDFFRGLPASGTLGGAGFRPGALPVILVATDAGTAYEPDGLTTITGVDGVTVPLSDLTETGGSSDGPESRGSTPGHRGASFQPTIDALNQLGALVIGLGAFDTPIFPPRLTLESLSTLTGAVNGSAQALDGGISGDPIAPGDPFYYLINFNSPDKGTLFANGIVAAVNAALKNTAFDVDVVSSDPAVSVENLTGVARGVAPGQTATFDTRITGDGGAHSFDLLFVRAGTGVVLGSVPVTINSDFLYPAQALDPDGDTVTYSLVSGPAGAAVDPQTGRLNWKPDAAGSFPFRLRAEDGRGGVAFQDFTVTVTSGAADQPPTITSVAPAGATAALPFSYHVTATDPDGDALSYLLDAAPAGMTIDRTTGVITWTPGAGQAGTQHVAVRVLDGRGGEATQAFDLAVAAEAANRRPAFTSAPPTQATAGQVYRYGATAADPDADPLRFALLVSPAGMTLDAATGTVVWEPTADQAGAQDVLLRVSDGRGGVDLQSFRVTAAAAETAPVISTPPPTAPAVVGLPYQVGFGAQDAENDALTFRLTAAPAGMTIDGATGVLSWTPTAAQVGTNSVTLTVTDSHGLQVSLPFTITVLATVANDPPTIRSTPRTSIRLGDNYLYQVVASDPNNDPLQYTLAAAPAGMTIDANGLVAWRPDPSQLGDQPVRLRVSDGRGGTAPQDFTVRVVTRDANLPPVITSTPPAAATVGRGYVYDLTGADPEGDPLIWTLDAAPAGVSLDGARGALRWTPTADQLGPAPVVVRLTDGQGGFTTQTFTVVVRGVNLPPVVVSTPPTRGTVGQAYLYAVRADDPEGDALTFALAAPPAGMTIDPATGLIGWTPDATQTGPNAVAVLVTDGQGGSATQRFTVVVTAAPVNQPPAVTTAPVTVAAAGLAYAYDADALDPEGDALTFALATAPAGMNIDPATGVIRWTPDASQVGSQPVALTVTDAAGNVAAQSYTLLVQPENRPPAITSTAVRSATAGLVYHYDVQASDPDGNALTYRLDTAPEGMTIDALGRISWPAAVADIGTHPVTLVVADPFGASASQSFDVTVGGDTEAPQVVVDASPPQVNVGSPATIFVSATDNVGVTDLVLTVGGTPLPLDPGGRAVFNADHVGTFDVAARAADAAGNTQTAHTSLVVIDPTDVAAPVVALTSPDDGAVITAPTEVRGTVNDPDLLFYTLSVAPVGGTEFVEFARGTSNVTDGPLGTFDPTMLQNDSYVLRLTALNAGGHESTEEREVHVADNLKLGNFTLGFTDLTVPVAGIPISVTRTYDTLTATESEDIGFGWRLNFRDTDLRTSVAPTGFEDFGSSFFSPFKVGSRVYVTVPGGPRQAFTFQPSLAPLLRGGFLGIFEPEFIPDPGVTSSLTVAPADLRIDEDGSVSDYASGLPYNPASPDFGGSYRLTTKDGLAFDIDAPTGLLTALTDANDNTLKFSDAGIVGPGGTTVTFERDPQGRVAAVVDPAGNRIQYQYDAHGDLVAVTDRMGNTTQFSYRASPAHYLDKVVDPLGRTGVRTEYDAQGRLVKLIDAGGNPVQLAYDPTHLLTTITDPLGNTTTEEYDARGNTVLEIDALGGTTRRTFDADSNMLTMTDPLGRTSTFTYDDRGDSLTQTDPLGNTSFSTYQAFTFGTTAEAAVHGEASVPFTRIQTTTDALGNTTAYAYDSRGTLVSTTDPAGNAVQIFYVIPTNNPDLIRDANGNATQFAYDGAGRPVLTVDALGHETSFTYDADGNRLSSTTTRTAADGTVHTLTTGTEYDADGRPVAVTDAAGGVTRTEYDAAGNKTAVTDTLGHRTAYVYDERNKPVETIYADDTPDDPSDNPRTKDEYDAAGRHTAHTDEMGQRTEYQYDALGRLVKTTNPDGTVTSTEYDAAGLTTAAVDEQGNRTEFGYDADGQEISRRDGLGNVTATTYDAAGRSSTVTDALGNTTTFVHDATGRVTETDNADGTKTQVAFDAVGQVVARTDSLGQTTRYEYDALGHVTAVVDALGNARTATYDELGNQLSTTTTVTAADGTVRTLTSKADYDDLGRAVAVTDAEGGVARAEYDAAGNRTADVDPLGRRTEYRYDARNQLVTVILPDATPGDPSDNPRVETEYDAAGRQTAQIDELGRRTEYQYDALGRLVKTIYPDGTFTQTEYDAAGLVTAQVDERGNRTEFQYDADQREIGRRDALGNLTVTTYDAAGLKASETDALGHTTHYVYDALGRLVEADYADGTKTTSAYDDGGRVTASTDQLGRTTHYEYDALGRVTAVVDPLGQRTEYAYDEAGNLVRLKDANGHVTTYSYDGVGRRTATVLPALPGQQPFRATTRYDVDGDVISTTDFNGDTITYAYDERNRLVARNYPDGTSIQFTYTLTGQQATVTDTRGTTHYVYDARDRLLSRTEPDGTVISYAYDAAGDRTAVTTPAGTTTYTFDARGLTTTVTDPDGGVTRYTYDAAANLVRTMLPNGTVETRGYDSLNRLTTVEDRDGAGVVILSDTYTLGPTGRRDAVVDETGRRVEYSYDALDRLTREQVVDAVLGDRTTDYTYDAVGNRLSRADSVEGTTTYAYDALDRLTTETLAGRATQYSYDKNGNMLSRVSATDQVFYTWDFDNRLVAADTDGDGTADVRNVYDAAGIRVAQTVGGEETRFLIDTVQPYPQVVLEYRPSGLVVASCVYGNGLISESRGGARSFYHVDGLGSTRALTDTAGVVIARYVYDAFGRVLAQGGGAGNPYLFAGQQRDAALELDYLRARYYDPALGRFVSADPLRTAFRDPDRFHAYLYGKNDPVNRTDPSGMLFGLTDFQTTFAVATIVGSVLGGIGGGIKGAFTGAALGALAAVAGAGLGVYGVLAEVPQAGAGLLGLGAESVVGQSILGSVGLYGLIQAAAGVHSAVTAATPRERIAAILGLIYYAATDGKNFFLTGGGNGEVSGAASDSDEGLAQVIADGTETEINLNGTPLGDTAENIDILRQGRPQAEIIDTRSRFWTPRNVVDQIRGDFNRNQPPSKVLIVSRDFIQSPGVREYIEKYGAIAGGVAPYPVGIGAPYVPRQLGHVEIWVADGPEFTRISAFPQVEGSFNFLSYADSGLLELTNGGLPPDRGPALNPPPPPPSVPASGFSGPPGRGPGPVNPPPAPGSGGPEPIDPLGETGPDPRFPDPLAPTGRP